LTPLPFKGLSSEYFYVVVNFIVHDYTAHACNHMYSIYIATQTINTWPDWFRLAA